MAPFCSSKNTSPDPEFIPRMAVTIHMVTQAPWTRLIYDENVRTFTNGPQHLTHSFYILTRMHSSRMRTARSLTVSRHIPRMPTPHAHCPPKTTHASPATMHAPQQPCTPPTATTGPPGNHAHPPTAMHTPWQLCITPSNPAHPLATTHAPWQPCTPPQQPRTPSNHACPPATTHTPPVDRIADTCKNITLPQTSFAGGN